MTTAANIQQLGIVPSAGEPDELGQPAYTAYGQDEKRPGFQEFLRYIEAGDHGPTALVFQRVDRLYRTVCPDSKLLDVLKAHNISVSG